MRRRPALPRWALWAFVAALLLKASMPMLATASAHLQAKAVFEVCTAYGVALAHEASDPADRFDSGSTGGSPDHPATPDHPDRGDHCALLALGVSGGPESTVGIEAIARPPATAPPAPTTAAAPDACASWSARLHHGPPVTA